MVMSGFLTVVEGKSQYADFFPEFSMEMKGSPVILLPGLRITYFQK
jgi:hypothetical protein